MRTMGSGALPRSVAGRLYTWLMFTFVGPFVGAVGVLLFLIAVAASSPSADLFTLLPWAFLIIAMGYIFGLGPATVSGLIYALLPDALQRLALAPLYGAIAVWLFYEAAGVSGLGVGSMSNQPMMLAAGALAALACAWIARKSGWTPDHARTRRLPPFGDAKKVADKTGEGL